MILDTNVISEPLRGAAANRMVKAWLDRQVDETLFLTTTSLSELLLGVEILPAGKRREILVASLGGLLDQLFADRILPFDEKAARAYAPMMKRARDTGRTISMADGQIAAIAAVYGFAVATKNTSPFLAARAPAIDPWTAAP